MVSINYDKIEEDDRRDGLKRYVTNTNLEAKENIKKYHGIWVVERAFRIGRTNLRMRRMCNFTRKGNEEQNLAVIHIYERKRETDR